ncbi:hypothetical protein D3C85_1512550 [compost metagenome]
MKRYRKRKFVSRLTRRRDNVVLSAVSQGIYFNQESEKFLCPCCDQRMCGKKTNGYRIPIIKQYQLEYDAITVQIKSVQSE